ncbi:hypothetical protein D7V90_09495 [bacterium 1xD42-87]|nr:hypothetical protein D7V90_09495 [bacterium 1xD42-87]
MAAQLYEMADIVMADVGRYGFVMLKYYKLPHGFEEDETFTDSRTFMGLWETIIKKLEKFLRFTWYNIFSREELFACVKKF